MCSRECNNVSELEVVNNSIISFEEFDNHRITIEITIID